MDTEPVKHHWQTHTEIMKELFDSAIPTSRVFYNKNISYTRAIMHKDSIHKHDGHDTQAVDSTVMCWAGVIGRHLTALTGDWNFRGLTKRSDKLFSSEHTLCVPELSEAKWSNETAWPKTSMSRKHLNFNFIFMIISH